MKLFLIRLLVLNEIPSSGHSASMFLIGGESIPDDNFAILTIGIVEI